MDSDKDFLLSDDFDPNNSIFLNSKCKYTKERFIQSVKKGEITPFYPPSPTKTYLNDIFCDICYNYYPRSNKTTCCNHAICTSCAIMMDSCPVCKNPQLKIKANCTSDQIPNNDSPPKNPDDIFKIAEEFKIDRKKVEKLLESGFVVEDLFNQDDFSC